MNTINQIFSDYYQQLEDYTVQVNFNNVWDYKNKSNTSKIFLISDQTEDVFNDDTITVAELKTFIVNNFLPIKTLEFFCEQTRDQCIRWNINENTKTINLQTYE